MGCMPDLIKSIKAMRTR